MSTSRREFLAASALAALAAALGRPRLVGAWQGQAQQPVFTPIRRNIGFFTMRGGTIGYLASPGGVAVVDSQFPAEAKAFLEGLNTRSGNRPVDFLINTHHHGDHTGGNAAFRGAVKKVVAHAKAAEHMRQPTAAPPAASQAPGLRTPSLTTPDVRTQAGPPPAAQAQGAQPPAGQPPAGQPPAAQPPVEQLHPDTTFTETWSSDVGDERLVARHYGRAHTSGDIVVTFERANVAHMGDLMFNRMHPVIDRTNGASIANWTKVLQKVASELPADTIYIFGHAGPKHEVTGGRADLQHHANYLVALLEYVREQVKAGKTREQLVTSTDVIKGFEDYGPLTPRPLGPAYDEVTAAG